MVNSVSFFSRVMQTSPHYYYCDSTYWHSDFIKLNIRVIMMSRALWLTLDRQMSDTKTNHMLWNEYYFKRDLGKIPLSFCPARILQHDNTYEAESKISPDTRFAAAFMLNCPIFRILPTKLQSTLLAQENHTKTLAKVAVLKYIYLF